MRSSATPQILMVNLHKSSVSSPWQQEANFIYPAVQIRLLLFVLCCSVAFFERLPFIADNFLHNSRAKLSNKHNLFIRVFDLLIK